MSERGEITVLLPVNHAPSCAEQRQLVHTAFAEARRLARTAGGRVLGLSAVAAAVDPATGGQALRATFAVDAPEGTWHRRKSFAVGRS